MEPVTTGMLVGAGVGTLSGWGSAKSKQKQRKMDLMRNALEARHSWILDPNYTEVTPHQGTMSSALAGGFSGGMQGAMMGSLMPAGAPAAGTEQLSPYIANAANMQTTAPAYLAANPSNAQFAQMAGGYSPTMPLPTPPTALQRGMATSAWAPSAQQHPPTLFGQPATQLRPRPNSMSYWGLGGYEGF